jgi:hypothetical protein
MSDPDDFEAYQKGYEDAMIAAGEARPRSSVGESRRARRAGRDIGHRIGEQVGYAFGWLILFPLFVALMAGSISWVLGLGFITGALFFGVIAFGFALFTGVVLVGFRLFLALWPVVIVVLIVVVLLVKLLG